MAEDIILESVSKRGNISDPTGKVGGWDLPIKGPLYTERDYAFLLGATAWGHISFTFMSPDEIIHLLRTEILNLWLLSP